MVPTYQWMIEGCLQRDPQAWRDFVTRYLPLARVFLTHYFPALAKNDAGAASRVFAATLADNGRFFRSFDGRAERELMVHFRAFLLQQAGRLEPAAAPSEPLLTLQQLEAALKDFPVLQRQVVWLFALGYSPQDLAPILNMKTVTAEEAVASAQEKLRAAASEAGGNWSADSLGASRESIVEQFAGLETKDCYPYLTFHRIVDGQITWRDRDRALAHLTTCFRCVDRFCTFQETVYHWRKVAAAEPAEVEAVLNALGLAAPPKKKSLLAQLFR